jgi:hypothetical protein
MASETEVVVWQQWKQRKQWQRQRKRWRGVVETEK